MNQSTFASMAYQSGPSGLAHRRGGQAIKPLSIDSVRPADKENALPTPRTSRSHLLAGLRTAPKTAMAGSFPNGPNSPTTMSPQTGRHRRSMAPGMYDNMNGPRTALPRFAGAQQQQQQQAYHPSMAYAQQQQQQQYTPDQVLAPQLQFEDHGQEQMDPAFQAQLMYSSAMLSEQQQRLQQQLAALQLAAQMHGVNLNGQAQAQMMQQSYPNMYQQQMQNIQVLQQVQNMQAMMSPAKSQANVYTVYDPVTGQQSLYVDPSQAQLNAQVMNQAQYVNGYANVLQPQPSQPTVGTPRLQVSPPPLEKKVDSRNPSPPRRFESPIENPTPLPPPSANAFRRGHKKSSSIANGNKGQLSIATEEAPTTSGPKTASFPLTPLTAGYGPGQSRAGEHPVRQPRNPPSMDEVKAKATCKHESSKNFVGRTRRSAVTIINNLVRATLERRKEARSTGSISPISESTEEMVETPMTDNDSESGRSGSGSLVDHDDAECSLPSSRTSTGSWGAIGSDRPSSRQKVNRDSVDSTNSSDNEGALDFASLLKKRSGGAKTEAVEGPRKAPMLVLTSPEKRKLVA